MASSAGALTGGSHVAMPYYAREQDWGPTPSAPVSNTLDVNATNIATATIDATRARLGCSPNLNITTDGPLTLTINCGGGRTTVVRRG